MYRAMNQWTEILRRAFGEQARQALAHQRHFLGREQPRQDQEAVALETVELFGCKAHRANDALGIGGAQTGLRPAFGD